LHIINNDYSYFYYIYLIITSINT